MSHTVINDDTFAWMDVAAMMGEQFHAIVTDPPYGLGTWDWITHEHQLHEWHQRWATLALSLVPPGGHMAVFSGTRHFHHMILAVESAGWELRDTLLWLKAGGMPKSRNRDGFGTGLKPSWEPIALFRKPLEGTIFATFDKYETGMLHIDAARIPTDDKLGGGNEGENLRHTNNDWVSKASPWMRDPEAVKRHAAKIRENVKKAEGLGRWPTNVLLDEEAAALLDAQTGDLAPSAATKREYSESRDSKPGKNVYGDWGKDRDFEGYDDAGGASRFFYVAKAYPTERELGLLGHLPCKRCGGIDTEKHQDGIKGKCTRNDHPTVKPIQLMQHLDRLLAIPGGRILDPFAGSGSGGSAAVQDGFDWVGVEKDEHSAQIARHRVDYWASRDFS